jgi:hypothetical protein
MEGGTVPGATIQLITNDFPIDDPDYLRPCECLREVCDVNTVSDEQGLWAMNVPVKYTDTWAPKNMLIKVSKGGISHYNLYQPSAENGYQGDLQLIPAFLYYLVALTAVAGGADPNEVSVQIGVAIGYAETGYPGVQVLLEGVTITAQSLDSGEEFPITYLGESGLPDPGLTATSSVGVFYYAVPDARYTASPSIEVSGDKPDTSFVSSFFPACPATATSNAVIDPYYSPENESEE